MGHAKFEARVVADHARGTHVVAFALCTDQRWAILVDGEPVAVWEPYETEACVTAFVALGGFAGAGGENPDSADGRPMRQSASSPCGPHNHFGRVGGYRFN